MTMEQRTRCLGGSKAEKMQESTSFQVRASAFCTMHKEGKLPACLSACTT
jgi:hypothetical protein